MVQYRRRRYQRRRSAKRGYLAKRKPNIKTVAPFGGLGNLTVGQMASTALRGVNIIKGLVNSELKRFDIASNAFIPDTGLIVNLNNIGAGTDASDRIGNSILAKYLTVNLWIESNVAADLTAVRALIVCDTMNQTAIPTLSDILQNSTSQANLISPLDIDNTDRFTVLMDRHYSFSIQSMQTKTVKLYKKLDFHIRYNGTTIGTYEKNTIFLVLISNQSTATNAEPLVHYHSRLAFYDN